MEKLTILLAACLSLFDFHLLANQNSSFSFSTDSAYSVKKSHYSHPDIKGFNYCYGYVDVQQKSEPTGYFTYNTDIYYAPFTASSDLFILRVQASFTPGHTVNINGNSYYDWNYMLWRGYIRSKPYQIVNGNKKSSTIHYVASWPKSTKKEVTVTTTKTISSNFQSTFKIGSSVNIFTGEVGVDLTVKSPFAISVSFSNTTEEKSEEPAVSHQLDNSEAQWNFQFAKSSDITYSLDTYYMYVVDHDSQGYQPNSFRYYVKINLTCVAWETYIWHQERDTTLEINNGEYGLY